MSEEVRRIVAKRFSVSPTPRTATALEWLMEDSGDSVTDVTNRSIQIHAFIRQSLLGGGNKKLAIIEEIVNSRGETEQKATEIAIVW